MKRVSKDEIIEYLGMPNGAEKLVGMNCDLDDMLDKAAELYIEEGLASALLVRFAKRKQYLVRLSENGEFIAALERNLGNGDNKIRRNTARLIGALKRSELTPALIEALDKEEARFVRPSMLLAIGSAGGEGAEAYLKAYKPAPPADETEKKHFEEETEALWTALRSFAPADEHEFKGFAEPVKVELRAPDLLTGTLAEELGELGFETFDQRRDSLKTTVSDYRALFGARCFTEALFPIGSCEAKPGKIAEKAKPFMENFMRETHSGNPPYRFRVELNTPVNDASERQKLVRETAAACESGSLINAPSNYEAELRVEGNERSARLYLKLFTVRDERFLYRKGSVPASMNPAVAAAVLRFAQEHLKVGARVIDPCCGSGTLLIERAKLSPCQALTGVDISHHAIDVARENTALAEVNAKYTVNDILRFVCHRPYDELICNLPFGNRVGTHSSCEKLYRGLIAKLPELVRKGGVAVLYTMEFTLLKNILRESPHVKLLSQQRTEAGGLTPMIFIVEVN